MNPRSRAKARAMTWESAGSIQALLDDQLNLLGIAPSGVYDLAPRHPRFPPSAGTRVRVPGGGDLRAALSEEEMRHLVEHLLVRLIGMEVDTP